MLINVVHPLLAGTKNFVELPVVNSIEDIKNALTSNFSALRSNSQWWSNYNVTFVDIDKRTYSRSNPNVEGIVYEYKGADVANLNLGGVSKLKIYFEQIHGKGGVFTEEELKEYASLVKESVFNKVNPTPVNSVVNTPIPEIKVVTTVKVTQEVINEFEDEVEEDQSEGHNEYDEFEDDEDDI